MLALVLGLVLAPLLPVALAQDPGPTLTLVWTGGSGGVGSGKVSWETPRRLRALDEAGTLDWVASQPLHGVMVQGEALLIAQSGRVEELGRLLQAPPTCAAAGEQHVAQSALETLITPAPPPPELAGRAAAAPWTRWDCVGGDAAATLLLPPEAALPDWEPGAWELRKALSGQVQLAGAAHPFTLVAHPYQDPARTVATLLEMQAQDPTLLYVDAGSFVDGASAVQDGALSLHRPLGWDTLERLAPAALVPGETELVAGPAAFFAEIAGRGLPYTAANWQTEDPALALPASVQREVQTPAGPVRVAFLGVLDPALMDWIPALGEQGVSLGEPVAALNAELTRLAALPAPPQAVVVLTTADAEVLAAIRRQVRGVDLLIGDPSLATLRLVQDEVSLRPLPSGAKGAAITLPMDGLAQARLRFDAAGEPTLRGVSVEPLLVRRDHAPDPALRAAVTATRLRVYPALDAVLLPRPEVDPAQPLGAAEWEQLVCEALRLYSGADLVALRALPPPPPLPGPLTELAVVDSLALLDTLELHEVPGARFPELLNKLEGQAPVSCGAPLGSSPIPRAGGRFIESARTYRVLTTDRSASGTPIGAALGSVRSLRLLDQPTRHPLTHPDGSAVTLRQATLTVLRAQRDAGADPVQVLTVDRPEAVDPLWLLRARTLRLSTQRFRGTGQDALAQVPETLATSPSSLSVGVETDLELEGDSEALQASLRLRGAYTALRIADQTQESADDVRLSAALAVPAWALPPARTLQGMPWTELLFDSELTPVAGSATRQADLSLTLGVALGELGPLSTLRGGAFVNRDLARLDDKPTEAGLRLEWELMKFVGPSLRISSLGEAQLWASTRDDDATDLRWRAFGELRAGLPLASWLELSLYTQGFAAQGRVPGNDVVGLSWAAGMALNAVGARELGR